MVMDKIRHILQEGNITEGLKVIQEIDLELEGADELDDDDYTVKRGCKKRPRPEFNENILEFLRVFQSLVQSADDNGFCKRKNVKYLRDLFEDLCEDHPDELVNRQQPNHVTFCDDVDFEEEEEEEETNSGAAAAE
jgi:hypothetical protein